MRGFLGSVVRRLFDWIMALYVRPSIKVTRFDIKETDDKKYNISFMALISNNTGKVFSVSQKCLLLFNGKKEVARIDVTRYENKKEKDICDELNILSPVDSIIMLKPGETKEIRIIDYEIERSTISKVRFSCFTGLKTCIFHLKTPQKKVCENKNTSKAKDELEKQLIWKKIKEKTRKLNSNIGAITWISTAAIAVIATGLKFMWYVYQRGKLLFWNIDASAISIIDNITLYSVFLYFLFGVVIITIMLMPFMIVKSNKKIWKKVAEFLILSLIFAIIIYKTTGMHSVIRQYGAAGVIASGIVMLIAFVCFFSLSWALGIAFSTKKEN